MSRESEVVDHLTAYLSRSKRGPVFVSGRPAQARKPNNPGDDVPGEGGKIAASSARPGKQTNQTVPYTRIGFQDFERSVANPSDALPGDVIFVMRATTGKGNNANLKGFDTNRCYKSATLRQINAVLDAQQREGYGVIVNPPSPGMLEKMEASREKAGVDIAAQVKQMRHSLELTLDRRPGAILCISDMEQRLNNAVAVEYHTVAPTFACKKGGLFDPFFDWRAVDVLREWSPDGVLLNKDDDERNADWFAAGGGDSGTVFNVAVQGPARLRNRAASETESAGDSDQLFDQSPCALDDVLLLLVCTPHMGEVPVTVQKFSFKYKPCSGRVVQLLSKSALKKAKDAREANLVESFSDATAHGTEVSERDVAHTVAVWKIGKIMDTKLVTGAHASVLVNVAIREINMIEARDECGLQEGLGVAHDLESFKDPEKIQYTIA